MPGIQTESASKSRVEVANPLNVSVTICRSTTIRDQFLTKKGFPTNLTTARDGSDLFPETTRTRVDRDFYAPGK
jgi:hypothetical protein